MIALLSAIFTALAEFLRLKNATAAYDLTRRIESDIENDEARIAALRDRGDDASQRMADRLRDRILRAQGIGATLPAAGPPAPGGRAGTDGGGDLHPAGR
jgi:hypothetical protein